MNTTECKAVAKLTAIAGLNPLVREPFELRTHSEGPLAGVPLVVKANIAVRGLPHCGASPALADHIAESSAPVVERLLKAGAVIVGQANMHELAFGITSHNLQHGPVGNPTNPAHMAGGSSGGTAAAIASGAVPIGLASDTGGSGRLPAAMCGCVGFRPTQGRYPGTGVLTLSSSFDTVTPMARNVAGISRLDAVLAGVPVKPLRQRNVVRLGVIEDALWQGVDEPMVEACNDGLKLLEDAGIELVTLDAPDLLDHCDEIAMGIVLYETQEFWHRFLRERGTTIESFVTQIASPDVADIFQAVADGAAPPPIAYEEMVGDKRQQITGRLMQLQANVDALIMPTLATSAPLIGNVEKCQINGEQVDLFTAMTRRALVASISGHPSISLPAGELDGLPVGLEVIGKCSYDDDLLSVAAKIEAILTSNRGGELRM